LRTLGQHRKELQVPGRSKHITFSSATDGKRVDIQGGCMAKGCPEVTHKPGAKVIEPRPIQEPGDEDDHG